MSRLSKENIYPKLSIEMLTIGKTNIHKIYYNIDTYNLE